MSAKIWSFTALDTFFFRDGFPYHAGEGGQGGMRSQFPPYMSTLQGVVRYALALGQGWKPPGSGSSAPWPPQLGSPDDLGDLKLNGPYLYRGDDLLFSAPLFLMSGKGPGGKKRYTRLLPGPEEVECDLGLVRLPVLRESLPGATPVSEAWINRIGLQEVQGGGLPASDEVIKEKKDLWSEEPRIGIARDPVQRTAAEHMLYSVVHVRPALDVSLLVRVDGIPEEWHQTAQQVARTIRMGGEGRLAEIRISEDKTLLPEAPVLQPDRGNVRFTITLVTPGSYGIDTDRVIREGPPGVPGICLSAVLGRVLQLGGWDLQNRSPRPTLPLIPAGSTWFFETDAEDLEEVRSLHGLCLGEGSAWGYGQVIIGKWGER